MSITGRPINGRVWYKSGPQKIAYDTNHLGFRDDAFTPNKKDGTRRIVVFGDSFTEGWGVAQDAIFVSLLRDKLEQRFGVGAYEVINFARQGTGPGFASCVFRDFAAELEPDVVIFMSFLLNDFIDSVNERRTCYTDMNPNIEFMSSPYFRNLARILFTESSEEREMKAIIEHAKFQDLSADYREKILNNEVLVPLQRAAFTVPNMFDDYLQIPEDDQVSAYTGALEAMVSDAMMTGVKEFLVFTIPASMQVSREQFEDFSDMGFVLEAEMIGNFATQDAAEQIVTGIDTENSEIRVRYIGLESAYAKASHDARLYLRYDTHISEEGHKVTAEEIFRNLMRLNIIGD